MLFKEVIRLVDFTTTQNEQGDTIREKTYTDIFANRKAVRQSEFYQAMSSGLRPLFVFEIRSFEYGGQDTVVYDSVEYNILRTYDKGEILEIVLQGRVV